MYFKFNSFPLCILKEKKQYDKQLTVQQALSCFSNGKIHII